MFTGLLFYAYVGVHQVRILVFDNYQRCPVSLRVGKALYTILSTHIGREDQLDNKYLK